MDAKYRFATDGASENDNAAEARLYNLIDRYADLTGAAFMLVHHASKASRTARQLPTLAPVLAPSLGPQIGQPDNGVSAGEDVQRNPFLEQKRERIRRRGGKYKPSNVTDDRHLTFIESLVDFERTRFAAIEKNRRNEPHNPF